MTVSNISRCTCVLAALMLTTQVTVFAQSSPDLVKQIADVMSQGASGKAHQRYIHAKGIVCQGTFQASSEAAAISHAAHFQGELVPVTVRFSDGAPDITVADNSPDASPRGMAVRFATGRGTDIMAISHNGFIVGTGEEFLALEKAIAATDPSKPHPWPSEVFMASHPRIWPHWLLLMHSASHAITLSAMATNGWRWSSVAHFYCSTGMISWRHRKRSIRHFCSLLPGRSPIPILQPGFEIAQL